jgi:hypothetical protein
MGIISTATTIATADRTVKCITAKSMADHTMMRRIMTITTMTHRIVTITTVNLQPLNQAA